MPRVTITDIASRAGVSASTASRALSRSRPVAPATTARVMQAVEELGYRRNRLAAALRTHSSDSIGLVVPEIGNPFFPALIESVERELEKQGHQLLLCDSRLEPSVEARRLEALTDHQVDGILISPCDAIKSRHALRATAAKVPLVQLDREVDGEPLSWVGVDDSAGLSLVMRHLADRGSSSVLFVGSRSDNSSATARLKGFLDAAYDTGLVIKGALLGSFSLQWGAAAARRLAGEGALPDAVVCANDLIAIGLLRELLLLGIRVPEDVLVTGFDDTALARFCCPTLTTVSQPHQSIAERALELLGECRSGSDPQRVTITPTLAVRESTTHRGFQAAGPSDPAEIASP